MRERRVVMGGGIERLVLWLWYSEKLAGACNLPEDVDLNRGRPPLLGGRRQVSGRLWRLITDHGDDLCLKAEFLNGGRVRRRDGARAPRLIAPAAFHIAPRFAGAISLALGRRPSNCPALR